MIVLTALGRNIVLRLLPFVICRIAHKDVAKPAGGLKIRV
jgi:hypothetical protein